MCRPATAGVLHCEWCFGVDAFRSDGMCNFFIPSLRYQPSSWNRPNYQETLSRMAVWPLVRLHAYMTSAGLLRHALQRVNAAKSKNSGCQPVARTAFMRTPSRSSCSCGSHTLGQWHPELHLYASVSGSNDPTQFITHCADAAYATNLNTTGPLPANPLSCYCHLASAD